MVKKRPAALREATATDIVRSPSETPQTSTTSPTSPAMTPPVPATIDTHSPSALTIEHDSQWSPMVQVLVGRHQVSFMVHKNFLLKIDFFKVCLDAGRQEYQTGKIKLPNDEPEVFAQVVYFVYYGQMEYDVHKLWFENRCMKLEKEIATERDKHTLKAIKVYCLAQKSGFDELQNWCIDRISSSLDWRSFVAEEVTVILDDSLPTQALFSCYARRVVQMEARLSADVSSFRRRQFRLPRDADGVYCLVWAITRLMEFKSWLQVSCS